MKQLDLFSFFAATKNFQNSSKKTEDLSKTNPEFQSNKQTTQIQLIQKQPAKKRQPEICSAITSIDLKKKLQKEFKDFQQNQNCLNQAELKFECPLKEKITQSLENKELQAQVSEETKQFTINSDNKQKSESKAIELSQETKNLINKLKSQQKEDLQSSQQKETQNAQFFNGPSLRQKFEQLTSNLHEIALPFEYQMLLNLLSAIDKTIDYLNSQHQPSLIFYKDLKLRIFKTYSLDFSLKKLQQILYLYQDAYQLEWQNNKKSNELDLLISLPKKQELSIQERERCFRALLNNYFKDICQNTTEQLSKKTWLFSNPTEIPTGKLPVKPVQLVKNQESVKIQPIEQFLKQNQTCNDRMKKVLQETVEQIKNDSKHSKNIEINPEDKKIAIAKSAGLSAQLITKIQEKEKVLQAQKLESINKQQLIANKQKVKTVAQIIKIYITLRKVSNVFYVQLIDHIFTSSKAIQITKGQYQLLFSLINLQLEEIADTIKLLSDLCLNWMTFINSTKGTIISFNKAFDIQEIFQIIDEAEI